MKILIASPIDSQARERLSAQHEVICAFGADEATLRAKIPGCEAIIFRSGVTVSAEVMAASPELKLLIRAGSGSDNLDLNYVGRRGLELVRIPEPGAKAVAELAFAQMLVLARNLLTADQLLRQGVWAKHDLQGYLLTGKTLGVVGAGNIGSRVGWMGAAWDMRVLGCVEHPSPARAEALRAKGVHLTTLEEVLAKSDFVSVHVPLTQATRNLLNARALASMKPGAFLVNSARGGIVDEDALYRELTTPGRLAGAALDVHRQEGPGKISPLASLPNVLLTPHIGANTVDTQREIGARVLAIVESFAGCPV